MKIANRDFQRFILLGLGFENEALCLLVVRRLVVGLDGESLPLNDGRTGHIMYPLGAGQSLGEYQEWYDNGLPFMMLVNGGPTPCKLSDVSPDVQLDWDLGPVWRFIDDLRAYSAGATASMLETCQLTLDEVLDLSGRWVLGPSGQNGLVLSLVNIRDGCTVMVDGDFRVETWRFDQFRCLQFLQPQ